MKKALWTLISQIPLVGGAAILWKEVASKEDREKVSQWIDAQIRAFPRCLFVITSRPGGYREARLTRAHVLEIMPFNYQQTVRFVHNWYLANKIISYGKDDAGVRQDAERQARDLLSRLRTQSNLSALTVNPLLLTMVATVHNYRGALPGRRVELYAEICDVMLGHWRRAKGIADPLTAAQKRKALQPLAAHMMSREDDRERRTIPAKEAMGVMEPHLKKVGLEESRIPHFLKDLQDCSGVFLEKEAGTWSFAHLTFQEYLCEKHWHETGEAASWLQEKWQFLIGDSWWHETLRLYAAQANATHLVNACLGMNTVDSLTLAAEMGEEALELEQAVRETLNARLEQDLESDDPDRFRLAAEVLLNRRLKKPFHSIDDTRSIDTDLITCAEYQLFIDHMRSQNKYHQPDHWTEFHFPKGQALEAIAGVRFEDAKAFCQWLSEKHGQTFRLPGREETKTFLEDRDTFPGFWEKEGNVAGLSPGKEMKFLNELVKNANILPSCTLTINLDRALDLDLFLKLIYEFQYALSYVRDRDGVRVLGTSRDIFYSRARARARARGLNLNIKSPLALSLSHTLPIFNALHHTLTLDPIRKFAFSRQLDCAPDLNHARELAHILSSDLKKSIGLNLVSKLAKAIQVDNLNMARELIVELLSSVDLPVNMQQWVKLISDVIDMVKAGTFVECRQTSRNFALRILESIYDGLQLLKKLKEEKRLWSEPWKKFRRLMDDAEKMKQDVLDLYWSLRIIQEREAGKLPGWEGIRLVREFTEE